MITGILGGLWVMALIGIRYPLKMVPILLFEFVWKTIWLLRFGLPQWLAGTGSPRIERGSLARSGSVPLVFGLVIPWGYVWRHYVRRRPSAGAEPRPLGSAGYLIVQPERLGPGSRAAAGFSGMIRGAGPIAARSAALGLVGRKLQIDAVRALQPGPLGFALRGGELGQRLGRLVAIFLGSGHGIPFPWTSPAKRERIILRETAVILAGAGDDHAGRRKR